MSNDNKRLLENKGMTNNISGRKPLDMNEVEMIFGTPNSPKTGQPDVHLIQNERRNGTTPGTNHDRGNHIDGDSHPAQPLLEPDRDKPKPPLAGPEIDDLDDVPADTAAGLTPYHGIDDGLLEPVDKKPGEDGHDSDSSSHKGSDGSEVHDDELLTGDGNWWRIDERDGGPTEFDGPHGHEGGESRPDTRGPGSAFDMNSYENKKHLAQGMMDLALLSANANQLRYVLETSNNHPYYWFSVVFISLSIVLQVAVGIGLIINSRYKVSVEKETSKADSVNDVTVLGVFLVTVVNVFITAFSVSSNASNNVPATTALQPPTG